jgi:hypothetical protein
VGAGLSAFLAIPCTALATNYPVTTEAELESALTTAVQGDTVTIEADANVSIPSGTILPDNGVPIIMEPGSLLNGSGEIDFSGSMGSSPAIWVYGNTATSPTTINGLTIKDSSTSGVYSMTIWLQGGGYATVENSKITTVGNNYSVYLAPNTSGTITGNTFTNSVVPVYAESNGSNSLTLTGNTFTEGQTAIDYQFLPGNSANNGGSTISSNKFTTTATSVTPPNSATGGLSTAAVVFDNMNPSNPPNYTPTPDDFNTVALNNPYTPPGATTNYPIVLDNLGLANEDPGASATNVYPFGAVYPKPSTAAPVPALDHRALLLLAALALGMASLFLRGPLFGRK